MTRLPPGHRRYVAIETLVGAVISAVLSVAFGVLIFGGQAVVAVRGAGGLLMDCVPQSAMIALMSSLVPTLLTRRRVARGVLPPLVGRVRLRHHAVVRAVTIALGAVVVGEMVHGLLLFGPPRWPFGTVVIGKALYGAMLGGLVARFATIAALTDPVDVVGGTGAATGRHDA